MPINPDDSTNTTTPDDDSIRVSVAGKLQAVGYPHWFYKHLHVQVRGQSHHVGRLGSFLKYLILLNVTGLVLVENKEKQIEVFADLMLKSRCEWY